MYEIEDRVERFKDMASKIPRFQKDALSSLFEILPYLEGQELDEMVQDINYMIEPQYVKQILSSKNPVLPDITDDIDGNLYLGKIMVGDTPTGACLVGLNDLIQTAIVAAPGKGKTKLIFTLIRAILKMNEKLRDKISVVMIDKKRDGRRAGRDFVVLDLDYLGLNFFKAPPNCDQHKWISDMSQLLMSRWGWYFRSRNYFMSRVNNLYEAKGKPPTLLEVCELINEELVTGNRISSRKLEVVETNLDRMENTLSEFGPCLSKRETFPLWEFLDSGIPLIIEADISDDSFALLLGWLLLYIYRYRKSNDMRGNVSEGGTIIIADEAFRLWEPSSLYSDSRRELGADFIATAGLYLRDFRTAIVAASQKPLSSDYMASVNLKIVGYCGDYEDALYLANGLGDPDLVKVILKLKPHQFLVKIGDKKPALIQTDDYPLQNVDDEELEQRMKPFIEYVKNYCKEKDEDQKEEKKETVRLSRDAKNLLVDVLTYPESPISARYFRLGFKGRRAQKVVEEVLVSKYAELVVEQIEGVKAAKYLVLTQQAIDWLKSQEMDVSQIQHIGRVGPVHDLYQNILQVFLRKCGYSVMHDVQVGQKFVDVLAEKNGRKSVYEIAVSDAVSEDRVYSALESVNEYIFICRDFIVLNSIRAQIKIQNEKIRYFVASQYLNSLKKHILDYYTNNTENNQNTQNNQNSDSFNGEKEENRRNQ
ncbi:MAG: hypothetical protein QXW91_00825 [Candidatus Nitrosotenuis sp.]